MKPRNIQPGQSPPALDVNDARHRYLYLRIGEIVRSDERGFVDVVWLTGQGGRSTIPISTPVGGPRSFLGGVPEEGALVVCGWKRASPNGRQANPVILGYFQDAPLPAFRHDVRQDVDDADWDEETAENLAQYAKKTRLRRRKGYPGDIVGGSSAGGDFLLDEDARLEDSFGDELRLRASDGAQVSSAVHAFAATAGTLRRVGPIQRNALLHADDEVLPDYLLADGKPVADVNDARAAGYQVLPDGRRVLYVTSARGSIPGDSPTLVEDRLEIRRSADPVVPVRGDLAPAEGEDLRPDIEEIHGTVVGNDVLDAAERRLYALPLRPRLWDGPPSLGTARAGLEPVQAADGAEGDVLARAASYLYRMRTANGDSVFIAQDGEGKRFVHLPRPGNGPGAEGRSLDADLGGGMAFVLGVDADGRSLGLVGQGDVEIRAGRGGGGRKSVSLVGETGVSIEGGTARDGVGVQIKARGAFNAKATDMGLAADGVIAISGRTLQEGVSRRSVTTIEDDVRTVGGYSYSLVGRKSSETIGESRDVTIGLGDTLLILLGNRDEKILAGNHNETILAGNHAENILVGSHSTQVGAGSWAAQVASGSIMLSTGVGTVTIATALGALALSCTTVASLVAGVSAAIVAPFVTLGPTALLSGGVVIGGIPGVGPHLDYITGMPLRGSALVRVAG